MRCGKSVVDTIFIALLMDFSLGKEIGDKVVKMANNQIQECELECFDHLAV